MFVVPRFMRSVDVETIERRFVPNFHSRLKDPSHDDVRALDGTYAAFLAYPCEDGLANVFRMAQRLNVSGYPAGVSDAIDLVRSSDVYVEKYGLSTPASVARTQLLRRLNAAEELRQFMVQSATVPGILPFLDTPDTTWYARVIGEVMLGNFEAAMKWYASGVRKHAFKTGSAYDYIVRDIDRWFANLRAAASQVVRPEEFDDAEKNIAEALRDGRPENMAATVQVLQETAETRLQPSSFAMYDHPDEGVVQLAPEPRRLRVEPSVPMKVEVKLEPGLEFQPDQLGDQWVRDRRGGNWEPVLPRPSRAPPHLLPSSFDDGAAVAHQGLPPLDESGDDGRFQDAMDDEAEALADVRTKREQAALQALNVERAVEIDRQRQIEEARREQADIDRQRQIEEARREQADIDRQRQIEEARREQADIDRQRQIEEARARQLVQPMEFVPPPFAEVAEGPIDAVVTDLAPSRALADQLADHARVALAEQDKALANAVMPAVHISRSSEEDRTEECACHFCRALSRCSDWWPNGNFRGSLEDVELLAAYGGVVNLGRGRVVDDAAQWALMPSRRFLESLPFQDPTGGWSTGTGGTPDEVIVDAVQSLESRGWQVSSLRSNMLSAVANGVATRNPGYPVGYAWNPLAINANRGGVDFPRELWVGDVQREAVAFVGAFGTDFVALDIERKECRRYCLRTRQVRSLRWDQSSDRIDNGESKLYDFTPGSRWYEIENALTALETAWRLRLACPDSWGHGRPIRNKEVNLPLGLQKDDEGYEANMKTGLSELDEETKEKKGSQRALPGSQWFKQTLEMSNGDAKYWMYWNLVSPIQKELNEVPRTCRKQPGSIPLGESVALGTRGLLSYTVALRDWSLCAGRQTPVATHSFADKLFSTYLNFDKTQKWNPVEGSRGLTHCLRSSMASQFVFRRPSALQTSQFVYRINPAFRVLLGMASAGAGSGCSSTAAIVGTVSDGSGEHKQMPSYWRGSGVHPKAIEKLVPADCRFANRSDGYVDTVFRLTKNDLSVSDYAKAIPLPPSAQYTDNDGVPLYGWWICRSDELEDVRVAGEELGQRAFRWFTFDDPTVKRPIDYAPQYEAAARSLLLRLADSIPIWNVLRIESGIDGADDVSVSRQWGQGPNAEFWRR